ncbi:DUF4267 domain-containing protein [Kribbella capetownensis]|uniref:DUF4267 domain-containing protein n=1 Tax=Kribbella capetownensis TaxID=1572659 RepID=A0A4R0JJ67_9ACTN|nr:DUF4267 domain-containing protein [Kribbella capetownensis]TCC46619.1 DUF4267 domain-containing protein [Kribbella capetownensis]
MRRFVTVLTVLLGLFPISFGLRFLFDGPGAAAGFGIDPWPTGTAAGYFPVKGIRDVAFGLVILVLFALGERRATGIVMALVALIPIVDMTVVLTHGGSVATALGIHGLTALVVGFDAWLLLRQRSAVPAAAQPVGVHS